MHNIHLCSIFAATASLVCSFVVGCNHTQVLLGTFICTGTLGEFLWKPGVLAKVRYAYNSSYLYSSVEIVIFCVLLRLSWTENGLSLKTLTGHHLM